MSKNTAQQEICMKKNHERSNGKILTRISDNLGKILANMARLNNLGKILVISWQDLAKISVLPRPCHDLPRLTRSCQDLQITTQCLALRFTKISVTRISNLPSKFHVLFIF
jgi:hypothetical protein